jgi:voltage-gated potassium channel
MHRLARRFFLIGLAILAVLVTGTVGFTLIEGYPVFDAFYMTLTTMTTVGYMEVHPLDLRGRIFNSFLIMFGVTTILIAAGAMAQTIIEMEFGDVLSKRRTKRMIDKLENHFIVCGYGRVGRGAAAELRLAGVPMVVIDRNPERVERAMTANMLAVNADSTRDETLHLAGITRARGMICALSTDADNLFVLLSAKALNPSIYVVARAAEEGAEDKMRRAGADAVFAPYAMAGHRMAQALLRPHVVQFLDFASSPLAPDVAIEQLRVAERSEMAGRTIRELAIGRDLGVVVLAILHGDGEMFFNPPADTTFTGGDYLIAMGKQANLRGLETLLAGVRPVAGRS